MKNLKSYGLMLEGAFEQRQAVKHAINNQDVQALKRLMDEGISPNIELPGMFRFYPLGFAIINGGAKELEIIETLIDAGASLDLKDEYGHTPLENAIKMRKPETMRVLLDAGADADQRVGEFDPIPILLSTKKKGFVEEVAVLLEYGADPFEAFSDYRDLEEFFSERKDLLTRNVTKKMRSRSAFGRFD